jgi:hypothetical protein
MMFSYGAEWSRPAGYSGSSLVVFTVQGQSWGPQHRMVVPEERGARIELLHADLIQSLNEGRGLQRSYWPHNPRRGCMMG